MSGVPKTKIDLRTILFHKNTYVASFCIFLVTSFLFLARLGIQELSNVHLAVEPSLYEYRVTLKSEFWAIIYPIALAPFIESTILAMIIFRVKRLTSHALLVVLVSGGLMAVLHLVNSQNYALKVLPDFLVYAYVFTFSIRTTSTVSALCRITLPHAMNNFAALFLLYSLA